MLKYRDFIRVAKVQDIQEELYRRQWMANDVRKLLRQIINAIFESFPKVFSSLNKLWESLVKPMGIRLSFCAHRIVISCAKKKIPCAGKSEACSSWNLSSPEFTATDGRCNGNIQRFGFVFMVRKARDKQFLCYQSADRI